MLSENIRNRRKEKGLSQEELAVKVNVVRQTVSKWEKGLSVPDSEMLIRLAEALDTSVFDLLGETAESAEPATLQSIAEKLEVLNTQFAQRNERSKRAWRIVFTVIICIAIAVLVFELLMLAFSMCTEIQHSESVAIIGGADGPTAIFVASTIVNIPALIAAVLALGVAILGLVKMRKDK